MFQTGYHATAYHATGYYLDGVVEPEIPARRKSRKHGIFYDDQYAQALREDDELLILCKSFIEIIRCH